MITGDGKFKFGHREGTLELYTKSGEHKADIYKDHTGWNVDAFELGFTQDSFSNLEEALDYLHVILSLPRSEEL